MITVDLYDAAGVRIGDGPLIASSDVTVRDTLNQAGSFSFLVSASDRRARFLAQHVRAVVRVSATTVADGLIERVTFNGDEQASLRVDCSDLLSELNHRSTLIGTAYQVLTPAEIISSAQVHTYQHGLLKDTGWSATVDSGLGTVWTRFDGYSRLAAILVVADRVGAKVRRSRLSGVLPGRQLEVGLFGADSGYRAVGYGAMAPSSPTILPITYFERVQENAKIVNWVLPLGGGEGTARVTLKRAAGGGVYAVQSIVGPANRTLYYLSDAASVARWGQREGGGPVVFKDVVPAENTEAAMDAAADALYTLAGRYLEDYAEPLNAYRISVLVPGAAPLVGDRITVDYAGVIANGGNVHERVRGQFYVVDRSITYGDATTAELIIADRRRVPETDSGALVALVRNAQMYRVNTHVYPSRAQWGIERPIASAAGNGGIAHRAKLEIPIDAAWTTVQSAIVRVRTYPLWSTTRTVSIADATVGTTPSGGGSSGGVVGSGLSTPSGGGSTSGASSSSTTPSGGGSTTPSGGGSTSGSSSVSTTPSGGGSTTPSGGGSTSGASSAASSANTDPLHSHTIPVFKGQGGTADLRLVNTGGGDALGQTGGSGSTSIGTNVANIGHTHGIAHTHTTPDHSHTTPNHTHDISHTHTTPPHSHTTPDHSHDISHTHTTPAHTHDISHSHDLPNHVHNITVPAHGHVITYGVFQDTAYPTTVRAYFNGVDVTSALGGPWATGGGAITDLDLNITSLLFTAYDTPNETLLRQTHVFELGCDSAFGMAALNALILGSVQQIAVG